MPVPINFPLLMIIKSMSRKEPSFQELLDYINRDGAAHPTAFFTHNCLAPFDGSNWRELADEFRDNARLLARRSNGNALYHEILSLPHLPELPTDAQSEALIELAQTYLEHRAPHQLAFGRVHLDARHLHLHLVISSNAVASKKREWLSKAQLANIQREVERLRLERFPELGHQTPYRNSRNELTPNSTRGEGELSRRSAPSEKQMLAARLDMLLATARNDREILDALKDDGYRFYRRGESWGVMNLTTGRKFRLKTLGLEPALSACRKRFDTIRQRSLDLLHLRLMQQQARQRRDERGREGEISADHENFDR